MVPSHRKPHAHPANFCRVIRLKYLSYNLLGNPSTIVNHYNLNHIINFFYYNVY